MDEVSISIPTTESQSLGSSPSQQRPESSSKAFGTNAWHFTQTLSTSSSITVILIDEYEDVEEEDLNCEEEFDEYHPSWEIDSDAIVDADADVDGDETTEDTALLHRPTRTAIVITPISPVSRTTCFSAIKACSIMYHSVCLPQVNSAHNLQSMDDQSNAPTINKSNLLSPDSG